MERTIRARLGPDLVGSVNFQGAFWRKLCVMQMQRKRRVGNFPYEICMDIERSNSIKNLTFGPKIERK